jgi:hypothetical protein
LSGIWPDAIETHSRSSANRLELAVHVFEGMDILWPETALRMVSIDSLEASVVPSLDDGTRPISAVHIRNHSLFAVSAPETN